MRFDVKEAGSRDVEEAVRQETRTRSRHPALRGKTSGGSSGPFLFTDRIVLVAGVGHPLSGKQRINAAKLEGLSLVGFEAGTAIRDLIDAAWAMPV